MKTKRQEKRLLKTFGDWQVYTNHPSLRTYSTTGSLKNIIKEVEEKGEEIKENNGLPSMPLMRIDRLSRKTMGKTFPDKKTVFFNGHFWYWLDDRTKVNMDKK